MSGLLPLCSGKVFITIAFLILVIQTRKISTLSCHVKYVLRQHCCLGFMFGGLSGVARSLVLNKQRITVILNSSSCLIYKLLCCYIFCRRNGKKKECNYVMK